MLSEAASFDTSVATRSDAHVYAKVTWRLIPFLLLCYTFGYLDRVNVGFAKLQMLNELKFSETAYGLGAGIFFLGYVLFEVPSNVIMHKVGARIWMARIMITWGIISACMVFVKTTGMFYLLRFLLGIAEAGFLPGILLYLTYWYPAKRRGSITALFLAGIPLAGMIGGPLSGWIMSATAAAGVWSGWQWMFFLEAIPSILLGIMVFFYLDNGIDAAKWLTADEKMVLKSNVELEAKSDSVHSLSGAFKDKRVWLLCLQYCFILMGEYGLLFWLPTIVKDSGIKDTFQIGMLTAIPYTVTIVAMILVGRSSDKMRERRWHLAIPGVLGAIGLCLAALYNASPVLTVASLTLAVSGVMAVVSQFWSLPPALLRGVAAAAGIALVNSLGNLAGFMSPYMLGWVKDQTGNTAIGLYVLAACILVGSAMTFLLPGKLVNK
ncbi:MAG: major Facilitator Superfamily protein [Massilia sp.]|nr:major Facilitator Superfamily protein [Massilia sp.]